MQKLEQVKSQLAKHFTASKVRSIEGIIRFNVPSLNDDDLAQLSALSTFTACDVSIKRSGTGLTIIVKI